LKIYVHEQTSSELHFVLPANPSVPNYTTLIEAALAQRDGGTDDEDWEEED
jgi:hypothetical protein